MSELLRHTDLISQTAITHELVKEAKQLPLAFCTTVREKKGFFPPPTVESAPFTIPVHWHEYLEFLYLLDGHLTAVVNATSYELSPGEFLIINSEELHMTQTQTAPANVLTSSFSSPPPGYLNFFPMRNFFIFRTIFPIVT